MLQRVNSTHTSLDNNPERDDEFFVVDLSLSQEKIDAFLIYCDDKIPSQSLLKKENEFQLIDFLVTQSKQFKAEGK